MKEFCLKTSFLALTILLSLGTYGQGQKDVIASDPYKAGGVYYMYDFDTPALSPAPKGYTPVYLSHYGRHGARYIYLEAQNKRVMDVFEALHAEGKLTDYGEDVYKRVKLHYSQTHHREGDLSPAGWDEHFRNASIIYDAYPGLFRKNPSVLAMSTLVPRCILSMDAFCSALYCKDRRLDIRQEVSKVNLPSLNPHASDNPFRMEKSSDGDRYTRVDPWGEKLADFTRRTVNYNEFVARITTDSTYLASLRKPVTFMTDVYNFVLNMQCTDTGVDLMDVFTQEELYALWRVDNYMYWVENGPTQRRDFSVSRNMISLIDGDLASDRPVVRLRFGHDSVILSILSILGVNGMGKIPDCADHIEDVWQNYNAPMGATFYMVFYKGKTGAPVLFKAVLNGREVSLPIKAFSGPYYKWEDFRDYFQKRYLVIIQ